MYSIIPEVAHEYFARGSQSKSGERNFIKVNTVLASKSSTVYHHISEVL
jgi:hypothetical protein